MSPPELFVDLKSWVEIKDEGKPIVIVYDLKSLRKSGQVSEKHKNVFDVFLADYLLSGGQGQYYMPALRASDEGMRELYDIQKRLLKEQKLDFLFYDVEMPLSDVLFEMEASGVKLDVDVLKELSKECDI